MRYLHRLFCIICVFIFASTALTGCSRTEYAENQAYAVMLGVDVTEDDNYRITVKFPKLAGSQGGSSGGTEGSSAYSVVSAEGEGFQKALDKLKVIMPREINLSALTLIIISEKTITDGKLNEVIRILAANYRMYSSAYIAICKGEASKFIEKQEPQIGSRLSEGLKALIGNGVKLGSIPDSRMADVYYRINSIYSDPIIMGCLLSEDADEGGTLYIGSYVVAGNGSFAELNERQTVLANVIVSKTKQFTYINGNDTAFVSVNRRPSIKVDTEDGLKISIRLDISVMKTGGSADMRKYETMIGDDIRAIMTLCRNEGVEPFGVADRAATKFLNLENWISYDLRERLKESKIDIEVKATEIF